MTHIDRFHYRLVLLGSHEVGKTSILDRFLFSKFETKYKPTVEDLFNKTFDLGSIEIEVDFLDTSGSMQFPAMRRLSITTGNAFLIVYSVDDESSFEVVKMCMNEIMDTRQDFQEIPIVFAGNKCDTPKEKRKVLKETVSEYVHYTLPRLRAKVIECSCKDNLNIDTIFRAYLSLAKVSLSTALSAGLKNRNQSSQQQLQSLTKSNIQHQEERTIECDLCLVNRRTSSMKAALGVRKGNADTSPLNKVKRPTLNQQQPTSGMGQQRQQQRLQDNTSHSEETSGRGQEVNLESAVRWSLSVEGQTEGAKPRSRSLIWRPRKSRQNNETPNCYPS